MPYATALHIYLPHIVLAVIVLCCLLMAGLRKRIALAGFIAAAALAPFLSGGPNNPASDAWFGSTPLLLLLAWRYRAYLAGQA